MSKLIAEPPLLVLRSLAVELGLNEAIVLQQVYWLGGRSDDGWVGISIGAWHTRHFPFWAPRTIERILASLVTTGNLEREEEAGKPSRYRPASRWRGSPANVAEEVRQSVGGSSNTLKEEPQKGKKKRAGARIIPTEEEPIGFSEWLGYHHEITGRSVPRAGTQTRSDLARAFAALVGQGYGLDDFKAVTDFGHLDPYWADKDLTLDWHLRLGAFGERVESGRRLREAVAAAPAASVDAVDWSRFDG